jgi:hypothetical protein
MKTTSVDVAEPSRRVSRRLLDSRLLRSTNVDVAETIGLVNRHSSVLRRTN